MRIRLDISEEHGVTVVSVQGQLVGDAATELRRVLETVEGQKALDLAMLQTADAEGVDVLVTHAAQGVEVLNPSRYIELLIERRRSYRE